MRMVMALSLLVVSLASAEALKRVEKSKRPRLIVLLVIDQFRADYLTRFEGRFLPAKGPKGQVGGFRYLMDRGALIPMGQFEHLQNMTAPGHAALLSGSYPYAGGIPINQWFDRNSGERVYCVEDSAAKMVGTNPKKPDHLGTSPKNFNGSTVGDELKNAGYASKVVAIALKDRAAILMGGHRADQVLWFDAERFGWVSSRFYIPQGELPGWVQTLNGAIDAEKDRRYTWSPSSKKASGLSSENTLPVFPPKFEESGFGKGFPHTYQIGSSMALATPWGIETTVKAAEAAVKEWGLGRDATPDLLAVSFSSHDYLGHTFGPNSLEMEEMTLAHDRLFARFFNTLNRTVPGGLNEVAFVLTADHGIPPNPEWLSDHRVPAGRIDDGKLMETVNAGLVKRLGDPAEGNYLQSVVELNFYLNPKALKGKSFGEERVQQEAKALLLEQAPLLTVVTGSEIAQGIVPPGLVGDQVRKTYHPGRSGDVVAIVLPFRISGDYGNSHQTGYSYDRTVPLLFAGAPFRAGRYAGEARTVDIAPTLSFVLGILPPSLSEGRILTEILK